MAWAFLLCAALVALMWLLVWLAGRKPKPQATHLKLGVKTTRKKEK